MELCNRPKDVHVLWVWSEFTHSPKLFRPLFLNFLDPPLPTYGAASIEVVAYQGFDFTVYLQNYILNVTSGL